MPPVVIGAGIAAVSALAASKMASSAQGKATKAQAQSTSEALAFQREQEANRRSEYDKSMQAHQTKWDAWNASRNALLQRYGVDIAPSGGAGPAGGGSPGAGLGMPTGGSPGAVSAPTNPMTGATLGDIAARGRPEWNDWSGYGLKR